MRRWYSIFAAAALLLVCSVPVALAVAGRAPLAREAAINGNPPSAPIAPKPPPGPVPPAVGRGLVPPALVPPAEALRGAGTPVLVGPKRRLPSAPTELDNPEIRIVGARVEWANARRYLVTAMQVRDKQWQKLKVATVDCAAVRGTGVFIRAVWRAVRDAWALCVYRTTPASASRQLTTEIRVLSNGNAAALAVRRVTSGAGLVWRRARACFYRAGRAPSASECRKY